MPDASFHGRLPRGKTTGDDWFDVWFSYAEADAILRVAIRWAKDHAGDQAMLRKVIGRRQSALAFQRAVARLHRVVGVKSAQRFRNQVAAEKRIEAQDAADPEGKRLRIQRKNRRAKELRKQRRRETGETWRQTEKGRKIELELPEVEELVDEVEGSL